MLKLAVLTPFLLPKLFLLKRNKNVPPNSIFRHNVPPKPILMPISADIGIGSMLDGFSILDYLYTRRIINQHFVSQKKHNVPPNSIIKPMWPDFEVETMLAGFAILDYLYTHRNHK